MALAGLVASYTDSEDELEGNDGGEIEASPLQAARSTVVANTDNPTQPSKSTDFFGTTEGTDNSSSDEEEEGNSSQLASDCKLPNPLATGKLPSAATALHQSQGSVFGNRFAQEEKAKTALYEKHVKMTEDKYSSKAPCFKFRKGACLKGEKCRFSHDRGFQAPGFVPETPDYSDAIIENPSPIAPVLPSAKKRPGVTNTLMPAKKAKANLVEQRARERPWTVGSSNI